MPVGKVRMLLFLFNKTNSEMSANGSSNRAFNVKCEGMVRQNPVASQGYEQRVQTYCRCGGAKSRWESQ